MFQSSAEEGATLSFRPVPLKLSQIGSLPEQGSLAYRQAVLVL